MTNKSEKNIIPFDRTEIDNRLSELREEVLTARNACDSALKKFQDFDMWLTKSEITYRKA